MSSSVSTAAPLPLSSLRLLTPPLRLLTAAMWQVARQQSDKHYGMLEDFVSLVTEAVPQLLTDRQRSLLLLALRAKVTLCDPDPQPARVHLDKIRSVSKATQPDTEVERCCSAVSTLIDKLTQSPAVRRRLLQDVFNQSFDSALQSLMSDFLSRIDQLFPVPDFKQVLAASWLHAAPGGVDECLQEVDMEALRELLTNQSCVLGQATSTVGRDTEDILLSAWSHPLFTNLNNHDPPRTDTDVQSDPLPDVVSPVQLDVELVKEEVVVMTEDEQDEQEEEEDTVIGEMMSPVEQEASNESSTMCSDDSSVIPVILEVDSISHNSQRVAHKCPQCGKCFIYRSQCNAVFRTKAELLSHQRSHRARPVYQCGQCDKEFHHLSSLTNHKQTHLDRGGFTCSRCDKVFESAKERDAHRLQHRLPDLTCTVCEQSFSSQTQLLRHLQTHSVEGAEPSYNCRFCDQTFSGVTQLRIHQRTHTFRSYQCDQCNKTYGSLTGLHSHRASHSSDSRFLCPQCGKRFKTRDGMEGHLRTHTGERPYRCPYCPKDFTALAGLNVHVRRHTGERPYVCSVCGKGWPSGGDLQKHMRTHTGERPYTCPECGKAFSISCHLTEHRRIHTGEKPFSCPECGKCLRRKFDLKKHMLSHNNIRPYACVYCPKSYTRKTHLNRHLLTHRTAGGEVVIETGDET
ncbi:hypothetical protein PAMP_016737 [Pampus punctatissimus]